MSYEENFFYSLKDPNLEKLETIRSEIRVEITNELKKKNEVNSLRAIKSFWKLGEIATGMIEVRPTFNFILYKIYFRFCWEKSSKSRRKRYKYLCIKLKYAEVDLPEENSLDDSDFVKLW